MEYVVTTGKRPRITHKTGAYLEIAPKCNGTLCVSMVETPKEHRGKGIGSDLHALAMMYAHHVKKPLTHYGVRINEANKNLNVPRSTRIARKLGFRALHGSHSIFDPDVNSINKALIQLGLTGPRGSLRTPGRPFRT